MQVVVWPDITPFDAALEAYMRTPAHGVVHLRCACWLDHLTKTYKSGILLRSASFVVISSAASSALMTATKMNSSYTGFPLLTMELGPNKRVCTQPFTRHLQLLRDLTPLNALLNEVLVNL